MMNPTVSASQSRICAIVLAGGQGARLESLSRRLVGSDVPKQYLPLVSTRSLLQETQARVQQHLQPQRTWVVSAKNWAPLAERQLMEFDGVQVVPQPKDAGTAAGLLLPLCHVLAQDPEAEVVVTPADHHFADAARLGEAVARARQAIATDPACVCLLGVEPETAATDLGWIVKGPPLGVDLHRVEAFVEKPTEFVAHSLKHQGAVWNTMVLVSRASTLWSTVFRHSPTLASLMEPYIQQVHRAVQHGGLASALGFAERLYEQVPFVDLSSDVLQHAHNLVVCTVRGAGWFDCGTPQRLFDWLRRSPDSHSPFRRLLEEDRAA